MDKRLRGREMCLGFLFTCLFFMLKLNLIFSERLHIKNTAFSSVADLMPKHV